MTDSFNLGGSGLMRSTSIYDFIDIACLWVTNFMLLY